MSFPLRTARLEIRPFTEADVDAAHRVYGDAEVMRWVGEGRPVTREETAAMLRGYVEHQAEHGYAFWAVVERGTGELIGDAGLEHTEHGLELGYTLARPAWGRGLATEAARAVVDAARGPLRRDRLVALADVQNPGSARVLEKVGFTPGLVVTAYGRPHRRFALDLRSAEALSPPAS